jgi:hypothetical protein
MISAKASNWVDRGESPVPTIFRVLQFFFDRHGEEDEAWLQETAEIVVGMVEANGGEVRIAGYLKAVARQKGLEFPMRARLTSIALWHIAKVGLVRDAAERERKRARSEQATVTRPLSDFLAASLLTPEEFAQYEAEGRVVFDNDSPYA